MPLTKLKNSTLTYSLQTSDCIITMSLRSLLPDAPGNLGNLSLELLNYTVCITTLYITWNDDFEKKHRTAVYSHNQCHSHKITTLAITYLLQDQISLFQGNSINKHDKL